MKKIFLILGLLAIAGMPVNAECATDYCVTPYDLSNGASRFFSSVTGSNFISQKVAQAIIKKQIYKNTDELSNLKVQIKSFSGKDLREGKFRSMKISGKNLKAGSVYLTELEANTICDFNYISPNLKNKNEVIFKEAFPIAFRVKMSQDDINKMILNSDYQKIINDLNSLSGSFGLFKISSTSIKIKDNKFLYIMKIGIPFIKGYQEVVISTNLKIKNGEIVFDDTKLLNTNFKLDLSKVAYMLNYLNPLDYSLNIIDNKNTELKIQNVSIENNLVVLEGTVTVLKDTVE